MKLPVVDEITARPLPPLGEDLPASQKVFVSDGELQVPVREITTADGKLRVYDTTGPQGHDVRAGAPKLRQKWVEARIQRGDSNFSQMHYARRGEITEEMRFVALRESVAPEFVRDELAARARHHPRQLATTPSSSR